MSESQLSTETKHAQEEVKVEEEKSLKGTLVSVGFVGAVIVVMWVGVFWLYMSRV